MVHYSQLFADTNIHLRCDEVWGFNPWIQPWMSIVCLMIILLFLVLIFSGYLDALIPQSYIPYPLAWAVIDSPPLHLAIVADLYLIVLLSLILCMFLSVVKPLCFIM